MPEASKTIEVQGKRERHMGRKAKTSLFKKIVRFLFIGLWESAYRRKKQRTLYRHRTTMPLPRRDQLFYYPRYRWIRRDKEGPSEKD
jgi:hypothetical protein